MQTSRQSGFAALEAILILIILAVIGGAGYYVWHSRQQTDTTAQGMSIKKPAPSTSVVNGLDLSSKPTFYDCIDVYGQHQSPDTNKSTDPSKYNYDMTTSVCTWNGQQYTLPKVFTDDDIRQTKGMHFTASEAAFLRQIGAKNFKACYAPPEFGTIDMYGEASGEYLYYGVSCDSGHREVAVLQNSNWKVVYSGQDIIACDTITKYDIPHSLFRADNVAGMKAQCFTGQDGSGTAVDIETL